MATIKKVNSLFTCTEKIEIPKPDSPIAHSSLQYIYSSYTLNFDRKTYKG